MSDLFNYCNDPDLWKESGKRIEARRKELGMRFKTDLSKAFSEYSPCTRQQIADWEKGNLCINKITDLATLSRILQCDPEYITCQCDTLRKEYADPVDRFCLSEKVLDTLSDAVSRLEKNYDNSLITKALYNKKSYIYMNNIAADVTNFLFEHIEIIIALYDLRELSLYPLEDTETVNYIGPDGKAKQIDSFMESPDIGAYLINNKQARFIAEQQLIEKLRNALEKDYESICRFADRAADFSPI